MLLNRCQAAIAATLRPKRVWLRQFDTWQKRTLGHKLLCGCSTAGQTHVLSNRRTASTLRSLQIGLVKGMQTPDFQNLPVVDISPPFIVGVAGGTASGKTSVCNRIIEQLQLDGLDDESFVSISQDSFYRDLTPWEAADVSNVNFDHPELFAFEEIVNTLQALKRGQPVEIPLYDFATNARGKEVTAVRKADVILFDGILAFYDPALRELFDMKIFVDCAADTRLARRVRRDIVERGRDVLQVLEQYERTVMPSFENYIAPTKKYADIIVPRGLENTVAIEVILQHLKFRLAQRAEPSGSARS